MRIFGGKSDFGSDVKSDFSYSSSVTKSSVKPRKLKLRWVIVGLLLFFIVPGFLFLAIPALVIYNISKSKSPDKPSVFDFLFEKESRVGMYNRMMKEGTGVSNQKNFVSVYQSDDRRGSGFEGSGLLKKLFGVGLLLFGLVVLGIFAVYVFVEYSNGFSSVPFLSEFGSVISAGLLVFGLGVVFVFVKLVSPKDERF